MASKLVSRKWTQCDTSSGSNPTSVTVMQWNILADGKSISLLASLLLFDPSYHNSATALSSSDSASLFIKAPQEALKWENRKDELLKEILRSGADVVCLEEVDHFPDFFQPKLKENGFEGFFKPKPFSPCLKVEGNSGPDGCALFYKADKFSCLDKHELTLRNKDGEDTNQVAILVKLELRESVSVDHKPRQLCVAVTHLKAKAQAVNIRAAQGAHLYSEMRKFCGGLPGVVCGDFNAQPNEPAYAHFKESLTWLESSYFISGGKEPPLTSWKFRREKVSKYTVDYIWYTVGQLQVKAVWEIPTEGDIGENGMPGWTYPSDHIALCTQCAFN
jgi:nocturnin